MLIRLGKKAQSTAEYAILLSLVVAAALGMQHEVRRAIQSRMHDAAMDLSGGKQYEPQTGIKNRNTTADQTISEEYVEDNDQVDFWKKDAASTTSFSSDITQ